MDFSPLTFDLKSTEMTKELRLFGVTLFFSAETSQDESALIRLMERPLSHQQCLNLYFFQLATFFLQIRQFYIMTVTQLSPTCTLDSSLAGRTDPPKKHNQKKQTIEMSPIPQRPSGIVKGVVRQSYGSKPQKLGVIDCPQPLA